MGCPRRFQRFNGAAWHFFQRFTEQFADKADGAAGDSGSTRQRAGAEDGDKEQRPDERVHGTAGDEQRLGKEVQPPVGREVVRGQDGERQGGNQGEDGAEGRDVEGFHQRRMHRDAVVGVIRREHAPHHVEHLFRRVPEEFPDDVDVTQRQQHSDADAQPESGAGEFLPEGVPLPQAFGKRGVGGVHFRH